MDGISVVVFLVHCTANLLLCHSIPTDGLRFADVEACRNAAAELTMKRRREPQSGVWMARCHYLLAAPDRRLASRPSAVGRPPVLIAGRPVR